MRVLRPKWCLLICSLAVLALPLPAMQTGGNPHPPSEPDHGLNETTHCSLWAGDVDLSATNTTDTGENAATPLPGVSTSTERSTVASMSNVSTNQSGLCALAEWTDIPLDSPPAAVEQWNRGDLHEFPETSSNESIHPPNATLQDGRFITDAYAAIFAVQPSTRARIAAAEQPLYVARNSSLLGTVDYRVALPRNNTTGTQVEFWELTAHEITETRLLVDGAPETTTEGNHTPHLEFTLTGPSDIQHTLTLEATIEVTIQRSIGTCADRDDNGSCTEVTTARSVEVRTETVTVRDSVDVVTYDLSIAGYRTGYPNGDLGLALYKTQPWLGYSLPAGDVRGVWRFYAARDPGWDRLVTSTDDGQTVTHSPLHPLQVNAYPSTTGPTASPRNSVTILATTGTETDPPTPPENVSLDVLTEPYTASYSLVSRTQTTEHDLSSVTAYGLVRGVSANASSAIIVDVPVNQSDLSLEIVNSSAESVTARVTLTDRNTGAPIQTEGRSGYVVLDGLRVNTSANGTVTTTLPRTAGGIAARYEPGDWWTEQRGYVGDSDVVYVRGTILNLLSLLYGAVVPVTLFCSMVFLIDRITGWEVWPPWRRL